MVRFHIWFLVVVLVGGPLAAGFFLGFDAIEAESQRAAMSVLREDAARAEARLAKLNDDAIREAAQVAQRASLAVELLPIAASTGNPLAARDNIKGALERTKAPGDLLAVADARGTILLRAKDAKESFALPAFADALRGMPRAEALSYEGQLYHVAAVPILSGNQVVGALAVGRLAAQDWAEKLAARGGRVAIVMGGQIAGSNLQPKEKAELQKQLPSLAAGTVKPITVGDDTYFAQLTQLPSPPGSAVVHVRSQAALYAVANDTRLLYLYIAGGVFLAALFWGFLIQRSVWRPSQVLLSRLQQANSSADPNVSVSPAGLGSPWAQVASVVNETLQRSRAFATGMSSARLRQGDISAALGSSPVAQPVVVSPEAPKVDLAATLQGTGPAVAQPEIEATLSSKDISWSPSPRTEPAATPAAPSAPATSAPPVAVASAPMTSSTPSMPTVVTAPPAAVIAAAAAPAPAVSPATAASAPAAQSAPWSSPPLARPPPPVQPVQPLDNAFSSSTVPSMPTMPAISTLPSMAAATSSPVVAPTTGDSAAGQNAPIGALLRASGGDPLDAILPALHEQFLAARRQCAESTDDVTFDRFSQKVRRVRAELVEQHRCDEVHFEVYVRAGRAALKAVPRNRSASAPVATLH